MKRLFSLIHSQWLLLLILLLAFALRLALWLQPLHQPANDEVEYITVAYDLIAGRGWDFYADYHWLRAPLYPLFLAGSLWLTGGNLYLAALPNIFLSVATVYFIYLLTSEILLVKQYPASCMRPAPAALIAALIAALLFTFNTFASLYMSETLFSFLFTAALVALIRWKRVHQKPGNGKWILLVLAGMLSGLAALTRSLPLLFLPVVLLWIGDWGWALFDRRSGLRSKIQSLQSSIGYGLLFTIAVILPIMPWTIRNCLAYESCILIETGLSYNLWAFNEPHEDEATIFRTLEQIPDPAARADEATRRGMERLREDPAILLRKLWPNWIHLWRVKIIQDRFLLADYSADPPPLVFLGSLLLDDLLYLSILVAGVFGLSRALAEKHPAALLLGLWIACVIAITLLTHGESRYRHFLFPMLIPFAAMQVASDWRLAIGDWRKVVSFLGAVGLVGVLVYTFVISYPWDWAVEGAARSSHRLLGDVARSRGDLAGAVAAYERALAVDSTPDGWIALGDVRRQQGDLAGAERAYRRAWRGEQDYIPASVRLGDLLRAQGRDAEARVAFRGRYVAEQAVIDWSWSNLHPVPQGRIDVGDGLDFGYVSGVYPAEELQGTSARWTHGHARFRLALPAASAHPRLLQMRLAIPRPDVASVVARVCVGNACQPVTLTRNWRLVTVALSNIPAEEVTLTSPTFTAPDGRRLGVLVDWVQVEPGNVVRR